MPAHQPPTTVPDPDLLAERDHLAASRSALTRMRDRTSGLDSSAAGDWVSQKFLESAIFARMKALADDPTVPLFFGRLDYDDDHADARGERFYIGRRHVSDEVGDPMVVDWRARISLPFYRASKTEPMGVELRRRFGFQHGEMTAYEDEELLEDRQHDGRRTTPRSSSRRSSAPASVRCATSWPPSSRSRTSSSARTSTESVCVQGAPGHRQDRGRPAPRRVPALLAPRPAVPPGRAGRRAERVLPALHRRRAPRARRDRRAADHHRGAGRQDDGPAQREVRRPRHRRPARRDAQGRRSPGRRRAPGALVAGADPHRAPARAPRIATLAPRAVRGGGGAGRAAGPRRAVRRRPRDARAAARARGSW